MTMVYNYENAKQSFDTVLQQADTDGEVKIRKDSKLYLVKPVPAKTSPLDVAGIDMNITTQDILSCIQESRKSF